MRSLHRFTLIVAGASALALPSVAAAKIQWLTCQLYDSTKNQVIHLNSAFAQGGEVDTDRQYTNFLAAAKSQGKIDDNSRTQGLCLLSPNEDEANRGVTGFVKRFKAQGATEGFVGFAPH